MEHSAYRIIDANFNRAREALRVIEDFCRFALNSTPLSKHAKQLRHDLTNAVNNLDPARQITSRDTFADVGIGQTVTDQLQRKKIKDCFTAAAKRLPEALRTIAEAAQTIDPTTAQQIENLRYAAYTLEKNVTIFSDAAEKFKTVKLYVIITSNLPADIISLTYRCAAGGADCIQLRTKNVGDEALFALAHEFVSICTNYRVLSIINDRPDIAVAAGADGVHLGQHDLPIPQAKKLQTTPLIIGKSTHSLAQLKAAADDLPTYVSLGPVFATGTKPDTEPVGLDYVTQAVDFLADTGIAHVAVGGITLDNVTKVANAGAKTIAICSAITDSPNPTSVCKKFKSIINTCPE